MGLWRVNRACRGFWLPAGRCPTGEMVREIPQGTHVFIQRDIGSQEGHAHAAFAPATFECGPHWAMHHDGTPQAAGRRSVSATSPANASTLHPA